MKKLLIAGSVVALGLGLSGPAMAGGFLDGCHVPQGAVKQFQKGNLEKAWAILVSANTDAGDGNGGEIVTLFGGCVDGLEATDSDFNIDANDLPGIIATDPGNSAQ